MTEVQENEIIFLLQQLTRSQYDSGFKAGMKELANILEIDLEALERKMEGLNV